MNTPYPIRKKFEYPILVADTKPTGRTYTTPHGAIVPSVTTILGITPKPELEAWRIRVGAENAKSITDEACRVGSGMHDTLEGYVSNYLQGRPDIPPQTEEEKLFYNLADNMRRYALIDLDEVWGIEEALYCQNIYAGRADLIGVYLRKPAIIDYKSSKRWKEEKYLEGYKMQIAAYNFAHKSMFDVGMEMGVILIAIRPPYWKTDQRRVQRIIMKKADLDYYEDLWLELVEQYHTTHQ